MPHNESGGKLACLCRRGNVDGAAAAAGLNSSVDDLSKWIRLQLGRGNIRGQTDLQRAAERGRCGSRISCMPISEAASKNNPTRHFNAYGMGWGMYDYYGRKIINHSGGLDGMLSYTVLIPEENVGFVVLTNNESPAFQIMMNKIRDVLVGAPKHDWNADAIEQVETTERPPGRGRRKRSTPPECRTRSRRSPLAAYAGTYTDQMYGDVTVTEENGKLVMRFGPSPNFVADLEHWHYDTFQIKWRPSVAYNFPRGFRDLHHRQERQNRRAEDRPAEQRFLVLRVSTEKDEMESYSSILRMVFGVILAKSLDNAGSSMSKFLNLNTSILRRHFRGDFLFRWQKKQ